MSLITRTPTFDIDKLVVKQIEGENYVCMDYISLRRQKHVEKHSLRNQDLFILVPCECGGGEIKTYVNKEHLRELLKDFND